MVDQAQLSEFYRKLEDEELIAAYRQGSGAYEQDAWQIITQTMSARGLVRSSASDPVSAAVHSQVCRNCLSHIPVGALKCAACADWVVETTPGTAAQALTVVGWLILVLSLAVAVGVVITVKGAGANLGEMNSPLSASSGILSAYGYQLAVGVLVQGFAAGLGCIVLASIAPRKPRD